MTNHISIPIFEKNATGAIKPNPVFHLPYDRLHSRCIEYPFAASNIGDAKIILDVGSAKADKLWISWLDRLNIDVYATDYDELTCTVKNIKFYKSDVRKMDFNDNTFDKIIAVSVIEHIGLENPQVFNNKEKPKTEDDGDAKAFKEFIRVLRPGGEIIMTFPFGMCDMLILGNQARSYTENSIKVFSSFAEPILLEYYEYQYGNRNKLFREHEKLFSKLKSKIQGCLKENEVSIGVINNFTKIIGPVTWRCIPRHKTRAEHYHHVEGVLCGVWRKDVNA